MDENIMENEEQTIEVDGGEVKIDGDKGDKKKEAKKTKKTDKKSDSDKSAQKYEEVKKQLAELTSEYEKLEAKLAETEDSRLRLAAEYDNFRRRSKDERDAMYADAIGESVRELLPIIDNLKLTTVYDDPEKIAEGVKLILKSVPQALEKLGVEEFGAVGEQFDPTLHNAVMHEENEELGENEISAVLQCGYRRGDKILRFAMVKVAN